MHLERVCRNEIDTRLVGETIGRFARAGDIYLLDGPLGAGKTTLVRAIAAGLGCGTNLVSSPTFVVVNEYPNANERRPDLIHVDAYRLSGPDDLESLGWDRLTPRRDVVIAVEWARRIDHAFTEAEREERVARALLDPEDETTRRLSFTIPDAWRDRDGVVALAERTPRRCPTSGRPVAPDAPTWPFADERAQMADLHRWMDEGYRVPREISASDELSE